MSGDHGYDPFGLGKPFPALSAAVEQIDELQEDNARLHNKVEEQQNTISDLRLELLIVLGYMEVGVPWWYGSSVKERIRSVLKKGEQDGQKAGGNPKVPTF